MAAGRLTRALGVMTRPGDIFVVRDKGRAVGLVQYVARDATQLSSHVVAGFRLPDTEQLALRAEDVPIFYAHVALPVGVKHGVFEHVGSRPISVTTAVPFRVSNDYGTGVFISSDWSVWILGGRMRHVSNLSEQEKQYDLGLVINPFSIAARLNNGSWDFVYPQPR